MKVTLDIDKLLVEERITAEEYSGLKGFAAEATGSLAFNILIGFGVVATAGGALVLLASAAASVLLGVGLASTGVFLGSRHQRQWGLLGFILVLVGSMTGAGGILAFTEGSVVGFVAVTVVFLAAGILAKSSLLAAMGALSLSASVGAMMAYGGTSYFLVIRQPTLTVVLFSALSLGAYHLSKRLPLDMQPVAITFSRTSLFLVNLGFWVGSLWGDSL